MDVESRPDQLLWYEKYRPRTVQECVLPKSLKEVFQGFVSKGVIPNVLLAGPTGIGKTTVARAMVDELGDRADGLMINASLRGNIETLRTTVSDFASSVSFTGGRKYVILDEADYLTHIVQPALRAFIEEFARNCGFIMTANYPERVMPALSNSRFSVIKFEAVNGAERVDMAGEFFARVMNILDAEGVEYDKGAVAGLVEAYFPNWRKVINELQVYSARGKVDAGVLSRRRSVSLDRLVKTLKEKDFTTARKWVAEHADIDRGSLFRPFYDECSKFVEPSSIPQLVTILARYDYQMNFVADPEVSVAAMVAEVMALCVFK